MDGWPCSASCLALGESGSAGVICDLYCVERSVVPSLLRADCIFRCCYTVNVHNQQWWPKSRMAGRGRLSMSTAPWLQPETHIKRNATRHDCLPSKLGGGDTKWKIMPWRKKYFVLSNQAWQHNEPNEPTKERPFSYVLRKSPFASVSTSQQGYDS